MANNVIHGEGKPRFYIHTPALNISQWRVSVVDGNTITLTIPATYDLTNINTTYGFLNRMIRSLATVTGVKQETRGKIISWNVTNKTFTVEAWENGAPDVNEYIEILDFIVDLPYCQELLETFTPDFVRTKLSNGNIVIDKKGFYYSATLDYSKYAHKDLVESLRGLFRADALSIEFYPRIDNVSIAYMVDLDPDSPFSLAQLYGHQGHKYLVINLIGKQRLMEIPLLTPSVADGWGDKPYGGNLNYGYGELGW